MFEVPTTPISEPRGSVAYPRGAAFACEERENIRVDIMSPVFQTVWYTLATMPSAEEAKATMYAVIRSSKATMYDVIRSLGFNIAPAVVPTSEHSLAHLARRARETMVDAMGAFDCTDCVDAQSVALAASVAGLFLVTGLVLGRLRTAPVTAPTGDGGGAKQTKSRVSLFRGRACTVLRDRVTGSTKVTPQIFHLLVQTPSMPEKPEAGAQVALKGWWCWQNATGRRERDGEIGAIYPVLGSGVPEQPVTLLQAGPSCPLSHCIESEEDMHKAVALAAAHDTGARPAGDSRFLLRQVSHSHRGHLLQCTHYGSSAGPGHKIRAFSGTTTLARCGALRASECAGRRAESH